MKWDDTGIAVCEPCSAISTRNMADDSHCGTGSFYRAAVPNDIQIGQPSPSTWNDPVAMLEPTACDPITNFVNHSIVFGENHQWRQK